MPTDLERKGNFSQTYLPNSTTTLVTLYDPATGQPISGNNLANATLPIAPQATALLGYYPEPNIPLLNGYNYQTISNAGNNNFNLNARYVRTLGQAANTPFGRFGGGGGGGRRNGGNTNAPPSLRQNINIGYNYSHSASDQRNIFLPLGGATESGGNGLNVGYTIGYGRLSNNATLNWNRLNAEVRNYFTNTSTNPSEQAGLNIPNNSGGFADPNFYNGLPHFNISNYTPLSNTTPSQLINQTISFSDFLSWRHKQHNLRFGFDVRRVHADSIGGNNPLGSFTFTGYATAAPSDQVLSQAGTNSGNAFADFLLGLPNSTSIQAGLYKTYLRENVYDWYVMDDYRLKSNLTLNYSLRYEYFGPYSEKNNRLVNLYPSSGPLPYEVVMPGNGNEEGLIASGPHHVRSAARLRLPAEEFRVDERHRPPRRLQHHVQHGQYATFARNLSHQPPFAETQNNSAQVPTKANPNPTPTGCTTTQSAYTYTDLNGNVHTRPATSANFNLPNGYGCAASTFAIQNNWAVDPNYRLGMVQIYNLNLQRTIPLGIVLNVGYNGAKGSGLDVVGAANATPSGVTTPGIAPFDWEESAAASHANALVVSAQKRQQKGIALGLTYTYSHAIDNASGVGGAVGTPVQNLYRLDLEEGNANFDQRHNLTGNWVIELPFGPNRAFLNKGGAWSYALDGFSLSGTFTFATGSYLTPTYSGNQAEAAAANTFTQRPDRVFTQSIKGPGTVSEWFNTASFAKPAHRRVRYSVAGIDRRTGNRPGERIALTDLRAGRDTFVRSSRHRQQRLQHRAIQRRERRGELAQLRTDYERGTNAVVTRTGTLQVLEKRAKEDRMKHLMAAVTGLAMMLGGSPQQTSAPAPQPPVPQTPDTQGTAAQQTTGGYTLTVNANIVLTNVVVRDRKTGALVKDLKASDFQILENGKPQKIASFDYENVDEAATLAEKTVTGKASVADLIERSFGSDPAKLKDHRLIVMFFDLSSHAG